MIPGIRAAASPIILSDCNKCPFGGGGEGVEGKSWTGISAGNPGSLFTIFSCGAFLRTGAFLRAARGQPALLLPLNSLMDFNQ